MTVEASFSSLVVLLCVLRVLPGVIVAVDIPSG